MLPKSMRSFKRGAASAFAIKVSNTALVFGVHLTLARLLGVDVFGVYIYAITWLHLLILVGKLGFDSASLRFVATYNGTSEFGLLRGYLRRSIQLVAISSTIVAVVLLLVVELARGVLSADMAAAFRITCLLIALTSYNIGI